MNPARQMIRSARSAVRSALCAVERRLHPMRHRRSLQRLHKHLPARRITFVCLGNICRSPYAAESLRAQLESMNLPDAARVPELASVGLINPGLPSPETARRVAAERGVSLDDHRSRVLDAHPRGEDEIFITMTAQQVRAVRRRVRGPLVLSLGDLDPGPIPRRDVVDPYGGGPDRFREVYERIDRALYFLGSEITHAQESGR